MCRSLPKSIVFQNVRKTRNVIGVIMIYFFFYLITMLSNSELVSYRYQIFDFYCNSDKNNRIDINILYRILFKYIIYAHFKPGTIFKTYWPFF